MTPLRTIFATLALAGSFALPGMAAAPAPLRPIDNAGASPEVRDFNETATKAPEPIAMTLLATGLVGLMLVARRKKKQRLG